MVSTKDLRDLFDELTTEAGKKANEAGKRANEALKNAEIPEFSIGHRSETPGMLWFGIGLTLGAGWYGWNLVQKHHVGVSLTPEQERLEPLMPPGDVAASSSTLPPRPRRARAP